MKTKRFLAILLAAVMMLVSVCSAIAYSTEMVDLNVENELVDGYVTARVFRESQSIMGYQDFIDDMNPENYGGIYLDENGTLNIWVVPSNALEVKERVDNAKTRTGRSLYNAKVPFSVIYRNTSRTIAAMQRVSDDLLSQPELLGVYSTRIDEMNNILVVCVNENGYDETGIAEVCSELNGGYSIEQVAENSGEIELQAATVGNGQRVKDSIDGEFQLACSVRFKLNGDTNWRYGFLTAGHNKKTSDGKVYTKGGVLIGQFVYDKYIRTEGVDFALIERVDSSISPGNFYDGSSVDYVVGSAPVGASVKLYVGRGNYIYNGTIKSLNYSDVNYKDFIETSIWQTENGDSGSALVYSLYLGSGLYLNQVLGTHTGSTSSTTIAAKTSKITQYISTIDRWIP